MKRIGSTFGVFLLICIFIGGTAGANEVCGKIKKLINDGTSFTVTLDTGNTLDIGVANEFSLNQLPVAVAGDLRACFRTLNNGLRGWYLYSIEK